MTALVTDVHTSILPMAFMVRSVVLLFILAAESADRHISYFLWLPWMTHACLWRRSAFSDLFYKYISGNACHTMHLRGMPQGQRPYFSPMQHPHSNQWGQE